MHLVSLLPSLEQSAQVRVCSIREVILVPSLVIERRLESCLILKGPHSEGLDLLRGHSEAVLLDSAARVDLVVLKILGVASSWLLYLEI